MKRFVSTLLLLALTLSLLAGCGGALGEITGSVADAARQELESQIQKQFDQYNVEIVEFRTLFGNLNDESDSKMQLLCAVLVRSNSTSLPQTCADALDHLFEATGVQAQSGPQFSNSHLVHKELTFQHTDFIQGGYYTVWFYLPDLTSFLSKGST